jgi:hypothetical protein
MPACITRAQSLSASYAWTLRHFDSLPFPTCRLWPGRRARRRRHARATGAPPSCVTAGPLARGLAPGGSAAAASRRAPRRGAVLARDSAVLPSTQLFLTGGDATVRGLRLPRHRRRVRHRADQRPAATWPTAASSGSARSWWTAGPSDWETTVFLDAGSVADRRRRPAGPHRRRRRRALEEPGGPAADGPGLRRHARASSACTSPWGSRSDAPTRPCSCSGCSSCGSRWLLALAALAWIWSGSEGSLARSLQLANRFLPQGQQPAVRGCPRQPARRRPDRPPALVHGRFVGRGATRGCALGPLGAVVRPAAGAATAGGRPHHRGPPACVRGTSAGPGPALAVRHRAGGRAPAAGSAPRSSHHGHPRPLWARRHCSTCCGSTARGSRRAATRATPACSPARR